MLLQFYARNNIKPNLAVRAPSDSFPTKALDNANFAVVKVGGGIKLSSHTLNGTFTV